ncbi:hypothetical protein R5M92_04195 [Halomonas sp. Bachu 37]|uniref:hypothetical protein n=1 Tax=Halomonas kashgarensis TaxID=3084920 RepID=UPI0032171DCE
MAIQDSSIQYAYALDDQGVLTHIRDAQRSSAYTCPGCKSPLSAILGEIKAKHFRHFEDCCALETYLHKCAKEAFFYHYTQALKRASPIKLVLERTICCEGPRLELLGDRSMQCQKTVPASYNLLRLFDQAELEKRDSRTGMQPDIMLSDSLGNRHCYVEIFVTHPCTQEKIDSGIPILEFKIRSATDIQILLSDSYSVNDERLSAYNWRPPSRKVNDCIGTCSAGDADMSVWSLSSSGRICEQMVKLADVDLTSNSRVNTWPKALGLAEVNDRLLAFLRHADPLSRFPNCLMCTQASQWHNGYVQCSTKAKRVPYTEARQCANYEADI